MDYDLRNIMIKHYEQATEHIIEQRALIKQQSHNATIVLWSTIAIAFATVVYALFAILQYFKN